MGINTEADKNRLDLNHFREGMPDANHVTHVDWDSLEWKIESFSKYEDGPLNFEPDYQRGRVWTREQQIAYLEYKIRGGYGQDIICINLPGHAGYDIPKDTDLSRSGEVVDGLQRLTAVLGFLRNEIPVFGHYRREFKSWVPSYLFFLWKTNHLVYRRDVLRWYLALNSTGTPHTAEEISRVRSLLEEADGL